MSDYYFANDVRCPYEIIDGETVVIDSRKGHLYLFAGTSSLLWQRLLDGGTIDGVVAELTSRYGEQVEAPTRSFLEDLVDAELLISRAPAAATAIPIRELPWPQTFTAPTMERYEEISSIISMDPIHDVHVEKGWPNKPDDPA